MTETTVRKENPVQKEFFDKFEKETGSRPESIELVSIEAAPEDLSLLGLEYQPKMSSLWGFFVFCPGKLYFYVQEHEYTIMGFSARRPELNGKEQLADLTPFQPSFRIDEGRHKNKLLNFFAPKDMLRLSFSAGDKEGHLLVRTLENAHKVAEKLSKLS